MLNPCQQAAVVACPKRLLIMAGAGTGKTYTVIEKIAFMIEAGYVDYQSTMISAFTNKAAGELRERLLKRFGPSAHQLWVGTFHSLALEVLQQNRALEKGVTILSSEMQLKVINDVLTKYRITTTTPSKMIDKIQRAKEGLDSGLMSYENRILELYNSHLREIGAVDFSDLIILTLELWDKEPDILAQSQAKARLICVDEYQDLSHLQHRMVGALLTPDTWLVCVGDVHQRIYGFRGANCEYIINFKDYFPEAAIHKLECNYRSGRAIIEAANRLINNNKVGPKKALYPHDPNIEALVEIKSFQSSRIEAQHIALKLRAIPNLSETAILVRNRSQMMEIGEALSAAGIPCISARGIERAEIKDLKAYMMLAAYPQDVEAFQRAILSSKNGIGKVAVEKIVVAFKESGLQDLLQVIRAVAPNMRQSEALLEFVSLIESARVHRNVNAMAKHLLTKLPRGDHLERWVELLPATDVLEYFRLQTTEGVHLMTIHASKGLEFDFVFLPCWEEGVLPHHGAVGIEIEEERCLAYVALTRARKYVLISYSTSRVVNGRLHYVQPSIFINELREKVPITTAKPSLQLAKGATVFHRQHGRGKVVECGANAVMVKFFQSNKLVMISELTEDK